MEPLVTKRPSVLHVDQFHMLLLHEFQQAAIAALSKDGLQPIADILGVSTQMLSQVLAGDKVLGRDKQAILSQLASGAGQFDIALAHFNRKTRKAVRKFLDDRAPISGNRATQPTAHGALPVEVQR